MNDHLPLETKLFLMKIADTLFTGILHAEGLTDDLKLTT